MKTNKGSSKTVNARQIGILLFIAIISTRLLMLPGLLSSISGRDAYISFGISAVATFAFIIMCLYICKSSTNTSFYNLIKKVFTGVGAKIVCVLYFVFFISKLALIDYQMEGFLNEVLYDNLNWPIFVLPVYLVLAFMSFKGPRAIARTAEIIFPIAVGVLVLAIFSGIGNVDFLNILPIAKSGAKSIFEGAIMGFGMGGEYVFLFIFIENMSEKSKITQRCVKYSIIGLTTVLFFMIIFTCVFGEIGMFVKDALTKLSQFSPLIRQNAQVNGIIVIGWVPIIVIESAVNLYCSAWCIKHIFNIKTFGWCIILSVVTIFSIKFIPQVSVYNLLKTVPNIYAILNFVLQFIIPLCIFVHLLLQKNKQRRQIHAKLPKASN